MSWLFTVLSALLAAAIGGGGMLFIATLCVRWYHIPSMEGQSGYYTIFLGLLGIVGGLLAGLIAARVGHAYWTDAWYAQFASAAGAIIALLLLTLAITYLGADHERERGGRGLVIAWELRIPVTRDQLGAINKPPAEWPDDELKLQLVSVVRRNPRGSAMAMFDRAAFRQEGGFWILPARVPLFTSKGEFCVNLTLGGRDDGFWPPFGPAPELTYADWSGWSATNKSQGKPEAEATMYRFRFEKTNPAK
jgi:MFS family permease